MFLRLLTLLRLLRLKLLRLLLLAVGCWLLVVCCCWLLVVTFWIPILSPCKLSFKPFSNDFEITCSKYLVEFKMQL